MRFVAPLVALSLLAGCHGRFKKAAPTVGAARAEVITLRGPDVDLPKSAGTGVLDTVVNITQSVREGNIASYIQEKVDPEQVNDAFRRGFADQLGSGPPFAYESDAKAVIQFELVDWGMEMVTLTSPGIFNYDLVVRGFDPNGKVMYRTRVRCATNAGASGWTEMSPFGGKNNENSMKNIPPEKVQAIFDATAEACGKTAVQKMRKHAG